MKTLFLTLFCTFSFITIAAAQTVTIKGKVISAEDGLSVIGATVRLNVSDSAKMSQPGRAVLSDVNGQFNIKSREKKSDITITFLGFKPYFTQIESGKTTVDLGTIKLEVDSKKIDDVVVVGAGRLAKVEGDTVQFNAASFKTNPDATAEDLVKKMPGVTVDSDGSVSSQGEKITKVLVNGKEYFDSDPTQALKSLPSDAVESVQMFDGQSDNARFSGMDDGERIRTVNIVTKAGVMKSIFGRAWAGYGTDKRYTSGLVMNVFDDNNRWTITAGSNNVNNRGFSLQDGSSWSRGGGRGMMRAEGISTGSFMTNARNGINESSNIGLNYNGTFKDKAKLNIQYNFGNINGNSSSFNTTDYVASLNPYYAERLSEANSFDNTHGFSSRLEWTPSDKNRINFNTRINYALNQGFSKGVSTNLTQFGGDVTTFSKDDYVTKYEAYNLNGDLWWQRALSKPGRTFSLGFQVNANKGMGDNEQNSVYGRLNAVITNLDTTYINRIGYLSTSGYSLTGSVTYNEPISKSSKLSINYNINYNRTIADQQGRNWDELVQQFSLLDTATTNYLNRNYTTHTAGIAYSLTKSKKINLNVGVDYLYASQNNDQYRPAMGEFSNKYSFSAVQPSVRLRITPGNNQNINLNLRRYSGFPSITQLQDVLDVTNPLSVSKGNPDLEQSYTTMLRAQYNIANTDNNTNFNIMLMGSVQENSISSNRVRLQQDTVINGTTIYKGSNYNTYVNMNGAANMFGFATYTFGIKPLKSNMAVSLHYRYSRQPSMQDGLANMTNTNSISTNLSLTSNISEKIDFTLAYYPSLNLSTNTNGLVKFNRVFSNTLSGSATIYLTRNLFINADGSWTNSLGNENYEAQHYFIVNGALGYKFLKNRQAELKLQAYDIFDQSRSYVQSISNGNIVTNTNYSILKRYFMFSFMYKFDTRKGRSGSKYGASDESPMRHPMRMMH